MPSRMPQACMRQSWRIAIVAGLRQRMRDDEYQCGEKDDKRPHPVRNQIKHDALPTSVLIFSGPRPARYPSGGLPAADLALTQGRCRRDRSSIWTTAERRLPVSDRRRYSSSMTRGLAGCCFRHACMSRLNEALNRDLIALAVFCRTFVIFRPLLFNCRRAFSPLLFSRQASNRPVAVPPSIKRGSKHRAC